jgi:hypothetical protein
MLVYHLGKLHVSTSNYQAIKYIMKKMERPSKKRFWKLPKEYRKAFYKEVMRIHENNLKTYVSVMTGNF